MTAHIHVHEFAASLQNGVLKDEELAEVFGREQVVGALAVVAGERPSPGVVKWTLDAGTLFGELNGQSSERVNGIVDIFQGAGLNTQASNEIVSATWSKMVGWTPADYLERFLDRTTQVFFERTACGGIRRNGPRTERTGRRERHSLNRFRSISYQDVVSRRR